MLSTRLKLAIARRLRAVAVAVARAGGTMDPDGLVRVRRGGIDWVLDLSEGIDLSIYLLGGFERAAHAAYGRLLRPGAVAIDIGANIDSHHTLPMARCVGDGGRVVAVEPTALAFRRMLANVGVNAALADRITPVQAMLTAHDDEAPPAAVYASWPVGGDGAPSDDAHPRHRGVPLSTEGARSLTLDGLVAETATARLDLVKMDVDGYEMEVLEGGRRVLAEMRPAIVMELAPYTWIERSIEAEAPLRFLRDAGYRFADLSGKAFSADGLSVPRIESRHSINILARPA